MSIFKLLRHDIKDNKYVFDLICQTINLKYINDYKMPTDSDYRYKKCENE